MASLCCLRAFLLSPRLPVAALLNTGRALAGHERGFVKPAHPESAARRGRRTCAWCPNGGGPIPTARPLNRFTTPCRAAEVPHFSLLRKPGSRGLGVERTLVVLCVRSARARLDPQHGEAHLVPSDENRCAARDAHRSQCEGKRAGWPHSSQHATGYHRCRREGGRCKHCALRALMSSGAASLPAMAQR